MDFKNRILPFYMTYPGNYGTRQEDTALRDLEYLQQMYPVEVKRYQRRVAEILDKMDYEGSMIYDEYPDRFSLQRVAKSIVTILQNEEMTDAHWEPAHKEKWVWVEYMVQILLYQEVYKRRHGGRRGFVKF